MRAADAAWFSFTNLMKNPMRTLLTILGLAVGVAAVLTVVTLGSAGQIQVEAEINKLGVDRVWVTSGQNGESLMPSSAEKIAAAAGTQASATASKAGLVIFGETAQAAMITGYDEAAVTVLAPTLKAGRFFTQREYEEGTNVALVDEKLLESLGSEVLGRYVSLGSREVRIIGVMTPAAAQMTTGALVLPLQTMLDTYTDAAVTEITVDVPLSQTAQDVAAMALNVLGDGYKATTLQEEIDAARSVIRIFVMVLASVAAVCMVTGGIGVMNILLVSVRERRQEIGLIKAVGGTSAQVAVLFLLEAVSYAMLGGLLGLVLGAGMIGLCSRMIGLNAHMGLFIVLPALGGAALIGVVSGVAPALKASAMLPAEALRRD